MVTEQNERLSKMVKTLLDMSELQTVARDEEIALDALVEEVLADLEPLAQKKGITLTGNCEALTMTGSDILIYRLVYNLVENAIKYNRSDGQVTVTVAKKTKTSFYRLRIPEMGFLKNSKTKSLNRSFALINPEAVHLAVSDLVLHLCMKL